MKLLMLKYVTFVAGFLLIAACLYQVSEKVEAVYPILTKRYQQLFDQKEDIEAITLGSSHSVAIDFKILGLKGYHLWDFGEDLFESEYKVRYILDQLPQLKTVFLNVPYPIFVHDNARSYLGSIYKNRAKLHYVTQQFELIQGDVNAFAKGKLAPLARYDHWVFLPKHFIQDSKTITPVKETLSIEYLGVDGNMRGETEGFQNAAELDEVALLKLEEHLKAIHQSKQQLYIEKHTFQALEEIIQLLKARNTQLILYTSPFYSSYVEAFPKDILQEFRLKITELKQKHQVNYYDFSEHQDFLDQPAYFQDGNHLSTQGAIAFSKLLQQTLDNQNSTNLKY